jgi:phage N-6-adenine-methyltransferase
MADFIKNRFEAKSVEYETPDSIFAPLNNEFGFTVDVCATQENKKVTQCYTKAENGLEKKWEGVCWCNPPYGREMPQWIRKAYQTAQSGMGTVVMLIPARTNTTWWHDLCMRGEIRFLKGRPKFNNGKHGLPFPLALVIFRQNIDNHQPLLMQ